MLLPRRMDIALHISGGKHGEWSDYFYFDTFEEAQADVEKEKENLDEDYNGASDLEAYKIIDCLGNIIDEGWGLMNITEIRAMRYELGKSTLLTM